MLNHCSAARDGVIVVVVVVFVVVPGAVRCNFVTTYCLGVGWIGERGANSWAGNARLMVKGNQF